MMTLSFVLVGSVWKSVRGGYESLICGWLGLGRGWEGFHDGSSAGVMTNFAECCDTFIEADRYE